MNRLFKADFSIVGKFARYSEVRLLLLAVKTYFKKLLIFYFKMLSFINSVALNYSNIVSSTVIGKTYEGRDIKVVVIKTSTSQRNVWIDCGIHARCFNYHKRIF